MELELVFLSQNFLTGTPATSVTGDKIRDLPYVAVFPGRNSMSAAFCAFVAFSVCFLGAQAHARGWQHPERLQTIDTLVFRDGEWAWRDRSRDVPALSCVGSTCPHDAKPRTVTCRNTGWDGTDVTWQCSAELPVGVTLGTSDVICEGWDSPEDSRIRTSSCSLEYTLIDRRTSNQVSTEIFLYYAFFFLISHSLTGLGCPTRRRVQWTKRTTRQSTAATATVINL